MLGNAQVARIDELDVLFGFLEPFGIGTNRIGGAAPQLGDAGLGMRFLFGVFVRGRTLLCTGRRQYFGMAAVTIDAAQANGSGGVHGGGIGLTVAGDAADAVAVGLFLRFAETRLVGLLPEQQRAENGTSAADGQSNCDATSGHQGQDMTRGCSDAYIVRTISASTSDTALMVLC